MYTIGQIAKRFGLSRSTLLYYDSIGLLSPSGRSQANYRLYSENDLQRMQKVALFRDAGLPLESIIQLFEQPESEVVEALEAQLQRINDEMNRLRRQQRNILNMLESKTGLLNARSLNKEQWVSLLAASGMNESDMLNWHIEFEHMSPQAHQDFLESLGIEQGEIEKIRHTSQIKRDKQA